MNASFRTLDLSRVYDNPVFRSRSAEDSYHHLRQALNDHALSWSPGEVDSALYSIGTRHLKLMILRYGPAVEVRPNPFEDFALVQVPLRGRSVIESDGQLTSIGPGQVAVIAPRRNLWLRWSENCEQFILRVPFALAMDAASRIRSGSDNLGVQNHFAPVTVLDDERSAQWCGLVQALVDQVTPGRGQVSPDCHPAWLEHLELGLALFLMTQARPQPSGGSANLLQGSDPITLPRHGAGPALSPLDAAQRYILAHLWAPISLEDLARAAGIGPRSLHTCCKREFGVGPMAWLRDIRLDEARKKIRTDPQRSITDIAMSVGLGHLGRFSAYYKARFGELPRVTSASVACTAPARQFKQGAAGL